MLVDRRAGCAARPPAGWRGVAQATRIPLRGAQSGSLPNCDNRKRRGKCCKVNSPPRSPPAPLSRTLHPCATTPASALPTAGGALVIPLVGNSRMRDCCGQRATAKDRPCPCRPPPPSRSTCSPTSTATRSASRPASTAARRSTCSSSTPGAPDSGRPTTRPGGARRPPAGRSPPPRPTPAAGPTMRRSSASRSLSRQHCRTARPSR